MARKPSEEKIREYEALKRFFVHWSTHVSPTSYFTLDEPGHPVNALTRIERELSFSQAFSGLRQAVNDCLEHAEDWSGDKIRQADVSLGQIGAPTLSELLVSRSKMFKQIVRRQKILNDTEYYLVSAALADTDSDRPAEETDLLGALLAAYEARA